MCISYVSSIPVYLQLDLCMFIMIIVQIYFNIKFKYFSI